ncbi:hypothetical protein V4R08_17125 (plasmid) [Nitrobacter sp. NHB1]
MKPTEIVVAARRLNRAAGMIAGSVLLDSAMEHYRGNFHNKAMWTPILTSLASIAVSAHGLSDKRHGAHPVRDAVYAAAGLVGIIGTGFHIYNVTKKVGGFNWQNLFYSAPLGAPAAMSLSGLMGFLAERVRENRPGIRPRVFNLPAGRVVAAATSLSMLGTSVEAGLLHFRGAFHNPAMLLPVTMPPVAAGLLAKAAVGRAEARRIPSKAWLMATAVMGVAGVALHAYGVSRGMGGWRNWRQNAFAGPPLPAPPAFTGLALAGLAALALLKDHARD